MPPALWADESFALRSSAASCLPSSFDVNQASVAGCLAAPAGTAATAGGTAGRAGDRPAAQPSGECWAALRQRLPGRGAIRHVRCMPGKQSTPALARNPQLPPPPPLTYPAAAAPAAAARGTMCSSPLPMHLRTTASEAGLSEPQRVDVEAEQQQKPQQPARRQPPVKAQQLAAMAAAHQRQQQQQQQGAAATRQGAKQPAKGKQLAAKGEKAAGDKGEAQKDERQRRLRGAQSLTALTALGTVALYGSVRGGISLFHHARRKFLTQVGAGRGCERGWWQGSGRASMRHLVWARSPNVLPHRVQRSHPTCRPCYLPHPAAAARPGGGAERHGRHLVAGLWLAAGHPPRWRAHQARQRCEA